MHYQEREPPAVLAPWIECVWTLSGRAAGTDAVLPDGRTEIVLNFGDRFRRHTDDGMQRQPRALFVGPTARAVRLEPEGAIDIMGFRFRPGAAATALGRPLGELRDDIPALEDVAPRLSHLIEVSGNDTDRAGVAAGELTAVLRRATPPEMRLVAALHTLETGGTVEHAAQAACVSTRHLERLFAEHVGLAPKTFARVLRVQSAARLAPLAARIGWARIAARSGFYDQAHLIRDFRQIAGCTPVRFFGDATLGAVFAS